MPEAIPREVRAFTFGLIMGVGGSPYKPREIARLVKERFGTSISTKTISNWKSNLPDYMKTYNITEEYVKEVIDRGLFGDLREKGSSKEPVGEPKGTTKEPLLPKGNKEEEKRPEGNKLPTFVSLADMVGYMERQGFIVATSDQDLRDILNQNGFTLLEKGALQYGPEIISVEPIELDFELVGKQIGGNTVIMWYYALARKLAMLTGEEPPELVEYVTGCVVDAMVARKWNMAVLRA